MLIALGAAKGLAFLHNAERPVIYRDFKTSNILLDSVSGVPSEFSDDIVQYFNLNVNMQTHFSSKWWFFLAGLYCKAI